MRFKQFLSSVTLTTTFNTGCKLGRNLGLTLGLTAGLGACVAPTGSPPAAEVSMTRIGASTEIGLPAMQNFAPGPAIRTSRSNTELARDFLDLGFRMESGRALPVLTRFEGPITLAMTGDVPAIAHSELNRLTQRLRNEAGIPITLTSGPAAITVDFQPKSAMRRVVPSAACFVVPNVSSLAEYSRARNTATVDWAKLRSREKVAVIAPSDSSPQEIRDCLHEEVAQALGPLNDLFRLPDSVFNDDNFHAVLTGFDMLMLRTHYAPELRSGMNEAEVAARLPAILARLNPAGQRSGGSVKQISPRSWISATHTAFTGRSGARGSAADQMLTIAKAQGWKNDTRLAFSHFAKARAITGTDAAGAIAHYTAAANIWRSMPGAQIHIAHVDMQLAAFALSAGQFAQAESFANRAIPVARQHQNASLLASLLAMKAEALEKQGQKAAAQSARLDSLGWARYAFGSDAQVRAQLANIATLAQGRGRG